MASRVSRLTIDLPQAEHKRLKLAASMIGTSMKDLVLISVESFMHRKLNKVTEKALKLSQKGKGLKKFKTLEDLFVDLGI